MQCSFKKNNNKGLGLGLERSLEKLVLPYFKFTLWNFPKCKISCKPKAYEFCTQNVLFGYAKIQNLIKINNR